MGNHWQTSWTPHTTRMGAYFLDWWLHLESESINQLDQLEGFTHLIYVKLPQFHSKHIRGKIYQRPVTGLSWLNSWLYEVFWYFAWFSSQDYFFTTTFYTRYWRIAWQCTISDLSFY
jgi:hypothetical protein